MKGFLGRNGLVPAVAGLVILFGAIAVWKTMSEPSLPSPADGNRGSTAAAEPESPLIVSQATEGEDAMSVQHDTQGVKHATAATFQREVLQSEIPVLVDFYADWCGPCKALAPTLEELARETPNAKVVKVNVDSNPSLAMRYGISSIPSLLVFKEGEIVAQHVGLASKASLQGLLTR